MLSEDERRVLAMFCFNHQVAACQDCQRGFKLAETHVEVGGPTTISPLPFLPRRPDRLAPPAHPHLQGDQPGSG